MNILGHTVDIFKLEELLKKETGTFLILYHEGNVMETIKIGPPIFCQ